MTSKFLGLRLLVFLRSRLSNKTSTFEMKEGVLANRISDRDSTRLAIQASATTVVWARAAA